MNIYFIRHGESEGNQKKFHQGEDVPMSEKGIDQANRVAKRLKEKDINVIYASPHVRTRQTADIISKELNLPVEYMDQLKELKRPSELEGLEYSHPKAVEIKKIIREKQISADWKYSDDESFSEILSRAKATKTHLEKFHKDQNVLCITHVTILIMTVLLFILEDKLSPEVFWQFYYHSRQKNTGITHLEYTEEFGWNLVTWNDTNHL
jgi:phosphoserine phosphatase